VSDPAAVLKGLGEPKRGEVKKLYHSPELTILNVIWAPKMTIMPHDHRMWAVIGVYTGREDNIFWRRVPGSSGGKLEAAGARALRRTGRRAVGVQHHPLGNESDPATDGRHPRVWRRFLREDRSEWDPETLLEERYNVERAMRQFEEANAGMKI